MMIVADLILVNHHNQRYQRSAFANNFFLPGHCNTDALSFGEFLCLA
jgi:hypothetical protein